MSSDKKHSSAFNAEAMYERLTDEGVSASTINNFLRRFYEARHQAISTSTKQTNDGIVELFGEAASYLLKEIAPKQCGKPSHEQIHEYDIETFMQELIKNPSEIDDFQKRVSDGMKEEQEKKRQNIPKFF